METSGSKEEGQEEQAIASEWGEMALPGFRFHPTEEELVGYYLRRMVQGRRNSVELIASLDLYQYDPWELPAMAFMGEKEWFFFCPRDKKYPNGARPNRVTASGYWKATGTDRPVRCSSADSRCIGLKKTLVFYTGRAPRGNKTEWIMNEYRMPKPAERSISMMTSGLNALNYTFTTYDNLVIKNDVALCRIYRKSSSVLNSVSFISAIGSRDLEERTTRMVSRLENSHPAAAHAQQQQHLLLPAPSPPNTVNVRVSSSEMPMPPLLVAHSSNKGNAHAQHSTTKAVTTASLIMHSHAQLLGETQRRQQQQQLNGGSLVRGSFDHAVVPSIIDCTTTSEEASWQLQIALRTAMAKLDGMGSSATVNFIDGESLGTNGSGIFGCFRNRIVQDASTAPACPSTRMMRSPSPEAVPCSAATAALDKNRSTRIFPTTHHEHFSHPFNSCSRDTPSTTPFLTGSSGSDNAAAPGGFTPFKADHSSCSSPRISIPLSFTRHHGHSSPSTTTTHTTTATTTQCVEVPTAKGGAIALNITNTDSNNSSYNSASSITDLDDEVQNLVNSCTIVPTLNYNTYGLKRSRFTRVQQLVGENCPIMAKMPSVAQYRRQTSSAPDSAAAAAAVAAQLSTFDGLSGLTFQY